MGFWRKTEAGVEYGRPSSERGIFVEGPLTVEDWKVILQDIVEEMTDQARREADGGEIR